MATAMTTNHVVIYTHAHTAEVNSCALQLHLIIPPPKRGLCKSGRRRSPQNYAVHNAVHIYYVFLRKTPKCFVTAVRASWLRTIGLYNEAVANATSLRQMAPSLMRRASHPATNATGFLGLPANAEAAVPLMQDCPMRPLMQAHQEPFQPPPTITRTFRAAVTSAPLRVRCSVYVRLS